MAILKTVFILDYYIAALNPNYYLFQASDDNDAEGSAGSDLPP